STALRVPALWSALPKVVSAAATRPSAGGPPRKRPLTTALGLSVVPVKVTLWPATEGLAEDDTTVEAALAPVGSRSRPSITVLGSLPPRSCSRRANWPVLTVTG